MSTTQPPPPQPEWEPEESSSTSGDILGKIACELSKQRAIAVPLTAMNLTWFAKQAITTSFLGRLGERELAGGTLGLTFANVTGYSILSGICGAMEPICGQAFGANNHKLLHKTLLMATILLLVASIPISFLWLTADRILTHLGQPEEMVSTAKTYLLYLLPELIVISLLTPLKTYLSAQGITVPIMASSAVATAVHVPVNVVLSRVKGIHGVAMAVWVSDFIMAGLLAVYVAVSEVRKGEGKGGGWWDLQSLEEWAALLRLSGPCCLNTCLEWWCYEILVLLTGRLPTARQAIGVLAIILNFDYLLFSIMLSLAVCASTRVSNELGAGRPDSASFAARVSLGMAAVSGFLGAAATVGARRWWGRLFSRDRDVVGGVRRMMVIMGMIEVANFPLVVSGGIVRGTARPRLGMYASLAGFYFLALPVGAALGFRARMGLAGMLLGFLVGVATCAALLLVFIARIDWVSEAKKAQSRASEDKLKDNETSNRA